MYKLYMSKSHGCYKKPYIAVDILLYILILWYIIHITVKCASNDRGESAQWQSSSTNP